MMIYQLLGIFWWFNEMSNIHEWWSGNLLSHRPGWAAAQGREVFLLLLDLEHQHQAGILIFQVVQQKGHEVVDDVGLIALSTRVHVNGDIGVF